MKFTESAEGSSSEPNAPFAALLRRVLFLFTVIALLSFTLYVVSSLKHERKILLAEIGNQADFTAASSQTFFDNVGYGLEMAVLQVKDVHSLEAHRYLFDAVLKRHPEIAFISIFAPNGHRLFMAFTDTSLQNIDKAGLSGKQLPDHVADSFESMQDSMDNAYAYSVGKNAFGKLIHQWRIPVLVTKRAPNGQPLFIAQAAIPISRQTSLWSNLGLLHDTRIGLYRDDGFIQSRWPDDQLDLDALYGATNLPVSPMENVVGAKKVKGYYDGYNSTNKDYRIGAYSRLDHLPLTAFVSIPKMLVYQRWWQHNYALVITFILLLVAFFGFATILIRHETRHSAYLARQADTDALTSLPNRQAGKKYLESRIADFHRDQKGFAVLFVDLDHFKHINDHYGHIIGDVVLKEVTARLREKIGDRGLLARLGGDEFMAVVNALTKDEVEGIVSLMGKAMEAPIEVEKLALRVSLSIGISMFPMDGRSAAELLRKADNAMYRIKKSSRDGYAFSHEGSSDHQAV